MKRFLSIVLAAIMLVLPLSGVIADDTLELSHEWDRIDMGETHSAAVQPVDQGYAWGYNYDGAIGNGVTASSNCPVPYHWGDNIRAVSANRKTTLAIDNNDVLYIFGEIWFGTGGNTDMPTPYVYTEPLEFATNVRQAVMGMNHLVYVKNDNTLWVYGENYHGQIGDNTTTNCYTAKQLLTNVAYAAAGDCVTAALKTDGTLWMWGFNTYGQVGNNSTTDRKTPVQVLTDVFTVSVMGDHVLAIKNDGSVWAWGRNDYGQLGNGNTTNQKKPVQVMTGAAQVSAGMFHSAVLKTDGTLWFAGNNYRGCFGTGVAGGYSEAHSAFAQTEGSYVAVKCGYYTTAVVLPTGQVSVAGYNTYGQLGTGSTCVSVPAFTPIDVWIFNENSGYLIGDADVNFTVDFADVSLYAAYLMNLTDLTPQGKINADANLDGELDVLDVPAIYNIALGN